MHNALAKVANLAAAADSTVAKKFSLKTLSAFGNPLDLFDQSLILDMLFLGAPSSVLG